MWINKPVAVLSCKDLFLILLRDCGDGGLEFDRTVPLLREIILRVVLGIIVFFCAASFNLLPLLDIVLVQLVTRTR